LISLLASAITTVVLTTAFGYFMNKKFTAIFLFLLSLEAVAICLVGAFINALLAHWRELIRLQFREVDFIGHGISLPGLMIAIALVAVLAYRRGHNFSGRRGALVISLTWLGWCAFCLLGYVAGSPLGLLLIALPSLTLLWIGGYFLSQIVLPLNEDATPADRQQAFRALITYTLGSNYPYYAVEDRKKKERAPGNVFRQFFAGPGIVMTSCDQTVVISSGTKIKEVPEPGLSFTGLFETIAEIIDLRLQLRAFPVEALTKDGIRIKVLTFVPFRIQAGDDWPKMGKSFPFRKSAVFKAMREQLIDRTKEKQGEKRSWDEQISIIATQVIRRIISQYAFDDLCAPYQPQRDPRQEIIKELRRQLKDEVEELGIQAIGGGISNLLPADSRLLQQRMDNWQAEWARRMTAETGKGEAEYIRLVESARAQAQAEMIRTISEGFERAGAAKETTPEMIALRFIEALEKMIQSPAVQQALPTATAETVEAMRRSAEVHHRQ
jgi:hypothetical protein